MGRRLRAVLAGLMAVGLGAVAGTAAADGTGPVATPPSSPQTQQNSGVPANGVQLSVTAPTQLPLDLPGQQLPEREVDVTVKDVGGQGYSGLVNMTLASEGSGVSAVSLRLDHYDLASGAWQTESIPSGESSFTIADSVTVPANGTQVLKLRMSPGTTPVSDVRLSVSANGATAVATMPVTGPSLQVTGLDGTARAGAPMVLTGTLTNPMDVVLRNIPVKLVLCSAGCTTDASNVKVEAQSGGGAWHGVAVSDATASSPMTATVVPQLTLQAGGTAQFSVRVTVGAGAFGTPGAPGSPGSPGQPSSPTAAQPLSVPVALTPIGLTYATQPSVSGTLTVQPPPQQTPPTPSSTPSTPTTSATPTPTATPTTSDTATATPTDPQTSATGPPNDAASTPGASGGTNPTVLVAAGLLAVCLALLLWWVLMKRRERMARLAAVHAGDGGDEDLDDGRE